MTIAASSPVRPALSVPARHPLIGVAAMVRGLEARQDMAPVWDGLVARLDADPEDAAALLDMSALLMARKASVKAEQAQAAALSLCRQFHRTYGGGGGLRLLAFVTAGDLMANTPLDFLLTGSDFELDYVYVDPDVSDLSGLPAHDLAIVAIAESPENDPILLRLDALLADWPVPVLNAPAGRIASLTRDGVCALFADEPAVLSPAAVRVPRADLEDHMRNEIGSRLPFSYPMVVRPIGSHAGNGLERITSRDQLTLYLLLQKEAEFFISPFIDYSREDGLFRKQRIAFIDGAAYAVHGATSQDWMIHYVNAGMRQHAERRAEEAVFMGGFEADYAVRHAAAFRALTERIGLDYFAIDCAELADGRLLLFEADIAMVIHDADDPQMFPYKVEPIRRLFTAFQELLIRRAGKGSTRNVA